MHFLSHQKQKLQDNKHSLTQNTSVKQCQIKQLYIDESKLNGGQCSIVWVELYEWDNKASRRQLSPKYGCWVWRLHTTAPSDELTVYSV